MGDWGEDKRHGFGSLAILDAQEIRKEERRSIENMMSNVVDSPSTSLLFHTVPNYH